MFTNLKPYPTYVESGNQWFGRLPVGWETSRLRGVSRLLVSNVDKLTHEDERPVRLCNYVDVYKNEFITDRTGYMTASASDDEIRRFRIRVDDVAITKDSESWTDIGVPAYVAQEADDLVCGYHLGLLRTQKERLSGAYLFRALQVPAIATQFHVAAGGVTRYGLAQDDIRSASVPIPSLNEQAAIVKYLGHANARIDRAIAAKRKLIALLEEQKQAVIHQIVTQGIDRTVTLKKSGVSGLGDIPAHWETRKLKHVAVAVGGMTPSKERSDYWQGDVPWVSPKDMKIDVVCDSIDHVTQTALSETGLQLVKSGALLFVVRGMILARKIPVAITSAPVTINQDMKALTPIKGVDSRYLAVVLRGLQSELLQLISESGHGTKKLETSAWSNFKLPMPSLTEQLLIVERVKARTMTADEAIVHASHEVELLREFRTRLTADVVTGQIDIRDAAARLPELDPADLVSDAGPDENDLDADLEESLEEADA